MRLVPLTLDAANAYVSEHHRHLAPVVCHRFAIGCEHEGRLVGVAIVANPVARHLHNGRRCEVVRCCTLPDAPKGAPSWLYARARRAAAALGYDSIVTYTLVEEGGASLRGAGWAPTVLRPRGGWNTPSRPRLPQPLDGQQKIRWESPC